MKRLIFAVAFIMLVATAFGQKRISATNQELQKFCTNYVNYIRTDSRTLVALLIDYPITVSIENKQVEIKDFQELLKVYDKVFYPAFKRIILNSSFSNYRYMDGYLVTANGELFICNANNPDAEGTKFKIFAVHNDPSFYYSNGIFK
ncbi:hypothetical protein B0I27_109117 [Arcticibacter pallidicorallinus]|uniref:Nuclear transport factor 2 family protein n=1 Tax=Arcticibacter pallidicorallinus TaxID=1259464 RepID=A0A2T0TXJ1_9SPHI|nr:hypothetical protein [Arcticibacter pallidicorallinus]PRY50394.1 hypothetical protein B0I27_109117 [Arcticibacter pallidicorallinus]